MNTFKQFCMVIGYHFAPVLQISRSFYVLHTFLTSCWNIVHIFTAYFFYPPTFLKRRSCFSLVEQHDTHYHKILEIAKFYIGAIS